MENISLYLHIPFCRHRCGYCDFNTYAGLEKLITPYVQSLCREVEHAAASARQMRPGAGLPVHTVFFGGGTPSLLPAAELAHILETLRVQFDLAPDAEISLEANPGTLSRPYLQDLRALGVNRLSLGMQSANPEELRLLERQHDTIDVVRAVSWARQAGFDNLNLDLIFGLPEQTLDSWQHTLELALTLQPEHLALYALTVEHGTPLAHWTERGLLPEPDPDAAADMYEWAAERLAAAGYEQYEISNWARRRVDGRLLTCRHNLQYWRGLPYLGFGAGAHGYAAGVRTANVLAPAAFIARLSQPGALGALPFPRTPATASVTLVDRQAEIGETMMMGLRLTQEGVAADRFEARFGEKLEQVFADEIDELLRLGLLEWQGDDDQSSRRLRLSERGRLLGNQVFYRFI